MVEQSVGTLDSDFDSKSFAIQPLFFRGRFLKVYHDGLILASCDDG
jgi:hypothetical protein